MERDMQTMKKILLCTMVIVITLLPLVGCGVNNKPQQVAERAWDSLVGYRSYDVLMACTPYTPGSNLYNTTVSDAQRIIEDMCSVDNSRCTFSGPTDITLSYEMTQELASEGIPNVTKVCDYYISNGNGFTVTLGKIRGQWYILAVK